ncbi:MAG: GntR family transcriptional regulator [Opitutaceae bacterium]
MKRVNSTLAYDFIRERILSGEYPPGTALMTEVLAEAIGVSRTPIRDALRKLEADGLVVIQAHLGARVKEMRLDEFKEMCEFRLALESHAAGLAAANRTAGDLVELGLALDEMKRLTKLLSQSRDEKDLIAELVREDVRFHVAIINASRNNLLKKEILRLHVVNRVVFGPLGVDTMSTARVDRETHRQEVIRDHQQIYDAVAASNSLEARSMMERHIQDILDNRLRIFAKHTETETARPLTPEEQVYHP